MDQARRPTNLTGRQPSLRRQLTLATLLPLVSLGLVAMVVTVYALHQTALDLVLQRNTALVQSAAAGVAENLNGYLRPLQTTADALAPLSGDLGRQEQVLRSAGPFLALFEGGVLLLDEQGIAVISSPGYEARQGRDYSFRDYFQAVRAEHRPAFSAVLQEVPSGRDAVAIAVPVMSEDGSGGAAAPRFTGALVGVFFLEQYPWAEDLAPLRTAQGGEVGLIDTAGIVISHSDAGRVGGNVQQDPTLAGLAASGRPQSVLTRSLWTDQEVVVSFAPLSGVGWGLLMEEPWRPIVAPTVPYQWAVGGLLGLGVTVALALLWLSLGRLSRPLNDLVQQARRVSAGSPFRPLPARGPAEVHSLITAMNQMVIRLAEQQAALRHYAIRVLQSQEEERKRISRDLHDETVQELVGLVQRIELAHRAAASDPAALKRRLDELAALAQSALADVRRMSNDLRPAILEDLGLPAALHVLCDELGRQLASARVHCEIVGDERRLPPELELTVFRIVQEALTNVRKHAPGAGRVNVTLYFETWGVLATVEDDGPGFEPTDARIQQGHLGLAGMVERAQLFEGELQIHSAPGQGTTVELRLPCAREPGD